MVMVFPAWVTEVVPVPCKERFPVKLLRLKTAPFASDVRADEIDDCSEFIE